MDIWEHAHPHSGKLDYLLFLYTQITALHKSINEYIHHYTPREKADLTLTKTVSEIFDACL